MKSLYMAFLTPVAVCLLAVTAGAETGISDSSNTTTTTTTTTTRYYTYDINQDMNMDQNEYVTHSYRLIDYDRDGRVDRTEWNKYTTVFYQPIGLTAEPARVDFVGYDVNGDGFIDTTEYTKAYDVKVYEAWDADRNGVVDAAEYQKVTTTYHDFDNDGIYDWVTTN